MPPDRQPQLTSHARVWVRASLAVGAPAAPPRPLTSQARQALAKAYACDAASAEACLTVVEHTYSHLLGRIAERHAGHGVDLGQGSQPDPPWLDEARQAITDLPAAPLPSDLLTDLHHHLFPRAVRHATGAYYTPDWFAHRVIAGLDPRPETVIDPSCGSGAFLLAAIDVLWPGAPPDEWLPRIAGIDNDPLAVLAAKVALLLRVPRARIEQGVELPIAVADAVLDEPPFAEPFDAVIGNPPWVFWNNLPPDYRERLREAMVQYGLTAVGRSTMGQLGAACKDLSMLFVHASADRYLTDGGQLAFIVPQTMLQSTAGHEFRRLVLPDGSTLGCQSVEDWTAAAPFVGAANKPIVLRLVKGEVTTWPVRYDQVLRVGGTQALPEVRLDEGWARPSDPDDPGSFWQLGDQPATVSDNATIWPARVGIDTKLEGLFRVAVVERNLFAVRVRNVTRNIKQPMPELEAELEPDLLYPVVAGSSLRERWGAQPDCCYLVPHTPETGQQALPLEVMEAEYPLTLTYFQRFKERLEQRSIHQRWGSGQPWYAVYNIGPYSFAPWRVVWKASGSRFGATVISTFDHPTLGPRPLLAAKSVILLPFEHFGAAHFVCGLLNTTHARERIAAGVRGWVHRQALNLVPPIPVFDVGDPLNVQITRLSVRAHKLTAEGASCEDVERELDDVAGRMWGLTGATR